MAMKIGVVSDTHGERRELERVVSAIGAVDLWLHAGDHCQDAGYLSQLTGQQVIAAAGNCDGQAAAKIDEFVDAEGKKIWLTHGHRYRVKVGTHELAWWARQYEVNIVVFGHSHQAVNFWEDDILFFNPGSAVYPRYGKCTCGIIEISSGKVAARIVEID